MKKNGFTTLLKATAVIASIGGLAYLYKDKIGETVSSIKGKLSKEEDDFFEDDDIFETEEDDTSSDTGTREYVSLDIEQTKKAAEELEEEMTLQEMEDAIEEEIELENELEIAQELEEAEEDLESELEDTEYEESIELDMEADIENEESMLMKEDIEAEELTTEEE